MMLAAVPPSIISDVNGRARRLERQRGEGGPAATRAISSSFATSRAAVITALTPRWVWLECASWPVTTVSITVMPLCAVITFIEVGSPTMTAAGRGTSATIREIIAGAPRQPTSSS